MRYSNWVDNLRAIVQVPDSPIMLKNGIWSVKEREKLWKDLAPGIFHIHLDKFKEIAITVLEDIDPLLGLSGTERVLIEYRNENHGFSKDLRFGVATTLALLANRGDYLVNCATHKSQSIAQLTIRELFTDAEWKIWGSLNDLLPILSEAGPAEFLDCIDGSLQNSPNPFQELFALERPGISGKNYLTGLLWALEGLAWCEEYYIRVSFILAELASIDPGGQWSNRPINSLINILLPWYPQTKASIEKRVSSLISIRKEHPEIAWKVLLNLLPGKNQVSTGTHKPEFLFDIPTDFKRNLNQGDYHKQIDEYSKIVVEMASEDDERLLELIGNIDNLPPDALDQILDHLSSQEIVGLPEKERNSIWKSLVDVTAKHRKFPDAKWVLPEKIIQKIEDVSNLLIPESLQFLYCRLFTDREFLLYEGKDDYEEERKKVGEKRLAAIQEILDKEGITGILELLEQVESPHQVGLTLGEIEDNELDNVILPSYLTRENKKTYSMVQGFVYKRYFLYGQNWIESIDRSSWPQEDNLNYLLCLPFVSSVWAFAQEWLGENEHAYWEKVNVNPYQSDSDPIGAVEKLLDVNRSGAALDCLEYRLHKKFPLLVDVTVRALLNSVSADILNSYDAYQATELIKALQRDPSVNKGDLVRIEWSYLPLLDESNEASPITLSSALSNDSEFFCEVVRNIYRSRKVDEKRESTESQKAIAHNAWRLLSEWKVPPGMKDDGSFVLKHLSDWLKDVRTICAESGHLDVAMIEVGKVLYYSPSDQNGLWIHKGIAKILNSPRAKPMRDGYHTEVINSRGAHWVDPSGKPEEELADYWRNRADSVDTAGFPRFAATLHDLAHFYEREAERIRQGI